MLQRTVARTHAESGEEAEGSLVRVSFERICTLSTHAVAAWMSGADPQTLAISGEDAWNIFGQLVAHRAIPLNEVTKRCLRWRDAARDALSECAEELEVSPQTLAKAISILQATLDATLVGMCEVFETERKRTDEELSHRQEELAFMATHDPLTGLPNRTLILDRGEQMLMRSRRHQAPVAALLINLDNFKTVNDTLGHGVGDELLRAVTARLDGVVRDTDALGRIGADEFVVIAEELSLAAGPELIAERVLQALGEPFELTAPQETRLTVTASIGISLGDRASAEEMLHDADIAMHRAKWDGKDRYVVFESGMRAAVQVQMELEMDLRDALKNHEYFLVYQPTFDLRGMTPTGMEALLRWNSPARGIVQPNDFIPVLEETGLISQVGRWILEEACRQGKKWVDAGHRIGMAVNVSGRQLDSDELVVNVRRALDKSGLEPSALTLEITETTLMRNAEETARRLTAIKRARRADRDRRLRHRLLFARPSAAVPRRRAEDRPLVHLAPEGQPRGRDADSHARAAGQGAVDRDARRGHRAAARAVDPPGRGVRQRPGFPVRKAARRGGGRGVPRHVAHRGRTRGRTAAPCERERGPRAWRVGQRRPLGPLPPAVGRPPLIRPALDACKRGGHLSRHAPAA